MYADVIFPLRLAPLTYKVPEGYGPDIRGRIVRAPLQSRHCHGLVLEIREKPDSGITVSAPARIKEIVSVRDNFASANHLQFLIWLSQYYLTPVGMALKSSFFEEAVMVPKGNEENELPQTPDAEGPIMPHPAVPPDFIDMVQKAINDNLYSPLLYHAADIYSQFSVITQLLGRSASRSLGAVILVPEISFIAKLEPRLRIILGDRLAVLHTKITRKERAKNIRKIISGEADVVLGTRSAMLAPIPNARLIAVIEEQSASYKGEEGLRYNARDLAVMKGYIEKACVLLMSACPSLESVYNAEKGKYRSLNNASGGSGRPRVRIIPFRSKNHATLSLSSEIIAEARRHLQKNEQILFLAGRKGYSLIRCRDCGHIEHCVDCDVPMVFYKSTGRLKCHHCGLEREVCDVCDECGGLSIEPFTAGTERIREDVGNLLNDASSELGKISVMPAIKGKTTEDNQVLSDFHPFVISTSAGKRKEGISQKYSAAVMLNIDFLTARPDFRAQERAFQEMLEVSRLVSPEGSILIQTRVPGSKFLKCLRNYDFDAFYKMELAQRKEIGYPPFEKIVLMSVLYQTEDAVDFIARQAICLKEYPEVTLLGPLEIPSNNKKYACCSQIIMKSGNSRRLHEAAQKILLLMVENKKIRVVIDVDPLKI
jgi:primosomal protein N' (replication factor Y) (superfamily II helicase)